METMEPRVLTVGQLNTYIKSILDTDYKLKNIFLAGEISNFKHHSSGHFYLTLKDETSQMRAVMFRGNAGKLQFLPKDGMRVICFGTVSVYSAQGQYQFYIENMQPDGIGSLSLAFQQLKERLQKEGLFEARFKKPLPPYPKRIGVATSPTGAAFQDVCNVLRRRWPLAEVTLSPCLVQGDGAPQQICKALQELDRLHLDVILAVRGGGSIEDLWCFNQEEVARTVFAMQTPVISGVGHETDFTMIDFVADCRAPTPSAAAELCVPNVTEELEKVLLLKGKLRSGIKAVLQQNRTKVEALAASNVLKSIGSLINERRLALDAVTDKMSSRMQSVLWKEGQRLQQKEDGLHRMLQQQVQTGKHRLSFLVGRLDALAPLKVLARGYSLTFDQSGKVVQSIEKVHSKEELAVRVSDGTIHCRVERTEKE